MRSSASQVDVVEAEHLATGVALVGLASLLSRSHMTAARHVVGLVFVGASLVWLLKDHPFQGPVIAVVRGLTASTRTTGWRSSRRSSDSPSSCPGHGDSHRSHLTGPSPDGEAQ